MSKSNALRIPTVLLACLMIAPAFAQTTTAQTLNQMGVDQKLGAQVPGNVPFMDENGNKILFGSLLGKRPIILLPIFYECAGVCAKETESVLQGIVRIEDQTAGQQYDVVLLSINPKETPDLAAAKKKLLLRIYDRPGSADGFHFLTGTLDSIHEVTNSVGFHYAYDEKSGRINHPAGIMVLTPQGKVSQYLFGAEYAPKVIETALLTAGKEKIGRKETFVMLGCIMIDEQTGKRSLVIENVIRLIAAACGLCLFGWIGVMSYKGRSHPDDGQTNLTQGGSSNHA